MTVPTCAGADTEVFFPENGDYRLAREYCEFCPVKDACLAQAMADERGLPRKNRNGMWGGLTPEQRERLDPHAAINRRRVRMP